MYLSSDQEKIRPGMDLLEFEKLYRNLTSSLRETEVVAIEEVEKIEDGTGDKSVNAFLVEPDLSYQPAYSESLQEFLEEDESLQRQNTWKITHADRSTGYGMFYIRDFEPENGFSAGEGYGVVVNLVWPVAENWEVASLSYGPEQIKKSEFFRYGVEER